MLCDLPVESHLAIRYRAVRIAVAELNRRKNESVRQLQIAEHIFFKHILRGNLLSYEAFFAARDIPPSYT